MASALLFGFLGAVVLFFFFFGFVMMAGYFGLVQIYELIDYPSKRRAVANYFRRTVPNQVAEQKRDWTDATIRSKEAKKNWFKLNRSEKKTIRKLKIIPKIYMHMFRSQKSSVY